MTGSRVDGLAIASQSRLIYFTDSNRNQIGIMSFDGRDRKIIVRQNISSPRAIVVDQQSGSVLTNIKSNDMIIGRKYEGSVVRSFKSPMTRGFIIRILTLMRPSNFRSVRLV